MVNWLFQVVALSWKRVPLGWLTGNYFAYVTCLFCFVLFCFCFCFFFLLFCYFFFSFFPPVNALQNQLLIHTKFIAHSASMAYFLSVELYRHVPVEDHINVWNSQLTYGVFFFFYLLYAAGGQAGECKGTSRCHVTSATNVALLMLLAFQSYKGSVS